MPSVTAAVLRPERESTRDLTLDRVLLLGLLLIVTASAIGARSPWPPDEPRYALVARDLALGSDWLLPKIGGDLYPDKPPLFFWTIAALFRLTASLGVAFLLPSLLGAAATLLLIHDLGRRLFGRSHGLLAGLLLMSTFQFAWQARSGQIDAFLTCWTTLALYGLVRHLLLGPAWGWYAIAGAAAGLGVITKGVGFLPLLILLPYGLLRWRRWQLPPMSGPAVLWATAPLAMLMPIAAWLLPLLARAEHDPAVAAYRDEILFHQTVTRYGASWHHVEPWWFYVVESIPGLWLPLSALLPWLVSRFWADAKRRNVASALLLGWVALVVVFFSCAGGKRGVYLLPALPALALAAAPHVGDLLGRRGVQRVFAALTGLLAAAPAIAAVAAKIDGPLRERIRSEAGELAVWPLLLASAVAIAIAWQMRERERWLGFLIVLTCDFAIFGRAIAPQLDGSRSGRDLVSRIEATAAPSVELGLVAYREQFLLHLRRPVVTFGHARWREGDQEWADAAAWLNAAPGRALVMDDKVRRGCFAPATAQPLGGAHRESWFLVSGSADPICVARGNPARAIAYRPPG